ncbi:hypothetical protein [Ensifer sesbaniae]|uniref:hypothetical protein n=1 Tax=Ensifer sesbaniae TaxID=1214071 RepID=UPI001FE362D1|nr:hypothetical protein [Ensifer sesbaniae]
MLSAENSRIRQTQAGEHKDGQRKPRRCAWRVLGLELLDFLQRPSVETVARFKPLDAVARIYLRLTNLDRPREHGADSFDNIVRGAR